MYWWGCSEALEGESSCGQTVGLGGRVARVRVRHRDAEALRPLLRVLAVLRLQDQRLVSREDLKRLRDIPRTPRYFYRSDLVYIYTFAPTLKKYRNFVYGIEINSC